MGSRASSPRPRLRGISLWSATLLAALWLGAGARAKPPGADLVPVVYPQGGCQSGWLEVQVYDGATERWRPHPDHPRVRTGSCFREPSDILLTDLRVRCVDPKGHRPPSPWVQGTDLQGRARGVNCPPGPSPAKPAQGSDARR